MSNWKQKTKIVIRIVLYAMVLGFSVSYCVTEWMPQTALEWITWGASIVLGIVAIYFITLYAAILDNAKKNRE